MLCQAPLRRPLLWHHFLWHVTCQIHVMPGLPVNAERAERLCRTARGHCWEPDLSDHHWTLTVPHRAQGREEIGENTYTSCLYSDPSTVFVRYIFYIYLYPSIHPSIFLVCFSVFCLFISLCMLFPLSVSLCLYIYCSLLHFLPLNIQFTL